MDKNLKLHIGTDVLRPYVQNRFGEVNLRIVKVRGQKLCEQAQTCQNMCKGLLYYIITLNL